MNDGDTPVGKTKRDVIKKIPANVQLFKKRGHLEGHRGERGEACHGAWGGLGGSAAGLAAGAAAGWVFAMAIIGLLSFAGVVWRAARKRHAESPTESDIRTMTPVAVAGTFLSALAGFAVLMAANWWTALATVIGSASVTAVVAVARCELRRTG
ncbi:MAG TPA: hypothetical protein VGR35_12745 [Tepidisphaeraceae bacterium]|nr:hypothetical protein [Tepidisphaeraceae bacterium]